MSGGMKCYPGTAVLINKYNIKDKDLLDKLEIQKVTVKLLSLDTNPTSIKYSYDINHLKNIHKFLFGDIYEWAGTYREENLFKSERVLSGGSAEYLEYKKIDKELKRLIFNKERRINYMTKILFCCRNSEKMEYTRGGYKAKTYK